MKAQIVAGGVLISIALAPNLFHRNNFGVTYVGTSNFRMELVRFVPLYYVAMPHYIIMFIEIPFTITPTHTITNMRSKPQTPKGIDLVSMHTEMPRKVDRIFAKQPPIL
jgi:hypothetical protein